MIEKDVYIILDNWHSIENRTRVLELGEKQHSSLRFEKITTYGMDGFKKLSQDAYDGFERVTTLLFQDRDTYLDFLNEFYIGKDVRVEYSDDYGLFRYGTISMINDDILFRDYRSVDVSIDLQPFKYSRSHKIDIEKLEVIVNESSIYSLPTLKVFGNGEGKVYINNSEMDLNIDESLVIDNSKIDIFDKNGNEANSRRIKGNFMRLKPGKNNVKFSGNISKIELTPNWRWL